MQIPAKVTPAPSSATTCRVILVASANIGSKKPAVQTQRHGTNGPCERAERRVQQQQQGQQDGKQNQAGSERGKISRARRGVSGPGPNTSRVARPRAPPPRRRAAANNWLPARLRR